MVSKPLIPDWKHLRQTDAAHLHALGVISLTYNQLEFAMSFVMGEYLGLGQELTESVFDRLTNRERIDILRDAIRHQEENDSARNCAEHLVDCFEICAENRNTLMHVIHEKVDAETFDLITRKKSADKSHDVFYRLSLETLRKVAEQTSSTRNFAVALSGFLMQRRKIELRPTPGEQTPLPEKPQKPNKLIPLPAPKRGAP